MDDLERLRGALGSRYRLETELGRGGMATVYLAQDPKHQRRIAIKVLKPDLAAMVGPERFLREIEIEAGLQHPNILPLHDSGEAEGFLYYVMPYVEGESLRSRLEREPQLPVEDALRVTREIADALDYAHANGVVHRDVKPENILLSESHAVLADFGIARVISEAGSERMTESGHSVGTPQYMSPEQAGGEAELDGRSDQYALGCVLYEMLAGEPPFTGRTAQAVIAKHMAERPPSLQVVRPSIPLGVARAIEKALAKTPADRYATAGEFVTALETPVEVEPTRPWWRRHALSVAATVFVAAAGLITWQTLSRPATPLDRNKVVVFPLIDASNDSDEAEAGWDIAIAIGTALEHTQPLKWIDGWTRLSEPMRQDARLVTADLARGISRERGARYYMDGVIRRAQDAVAVVLRLHDAEGDSLIAQQTSSGEVQTASLADLGLSAATSLIARLVEPDREVDISALTQRDAAAVTLWLQGERQYRQARFEPALELYQRAVERDSAFAFAALKGAQAANWRNEHEEARRLSRMAVAHDSILPPKYAYLAHGFHAYLSGQADSATSHFKLAIAQDLEWAEPATVLGETYYHMYPREAPLDSLAAYWFERALELDSAFHIPLVHLAEIALRDGDLETAGALTEHLASTDPDVMQLERLRLALGCFAQGPSCLAWSDSVGMDSLEVLLMTSNMLAAGGAYPAYAKQGYATTMASTEGAYGVEWGGLQGLQGLLLAEGQYEEARALVDSAVNADMPAAMILHLFDASLGYISDPRLAEVMEPRAQEAADFGREIAGEDLAGATSHTFWLLGTWHAHRGDVATAQRILASLQRRAEESGEREERLLAAALEPHVTLASGDTALAVFQLRALSPTAPRHGLDWELSEPLPLERLLLAELLLAQGEYREAYAVATSFDHQQSIMNLACLRPSLVIRLRAMEALRESVYVRRYRSRLEALGWSDESDT